MIIKQYYDKYLKKPNEGVCKICNNESIFISISSGYSNKCSLHKNKYKLINPKPTSKTHSCLICGFTSKKLKYHINNNHDLSEKEYYDKYLKQPDEGICPVCGKSTNFIGYLYGYRQHCSTSCSSSDKKVQEKNKNTNLERYGVKHNWNNGPLREHCKETMIERYGVDHNWKSSELRSKENFKISELEQYFINKLKLYKINYKYRYYGNDIYPYECDFYLPESNTFIEIHGTAFHDDHIFNPTSEEDIKNLEYYKSRTDSSWYQSKVRIWLKDKEKYDFAIKNKLNLIILWNRYDIDNYFINIRK